MWQVLLLGKKNCGGWSFRTEEKLKWNLFRREEKNGVELFPIVPEWPYMVTGLARMLFAANRILERASSAGGLSKKGAMALSILQAEDSPDAAMHNQDLQERFIKHNVSSSASAGKDTSAAKSELLKKHYIETTDSVSKFRLNQQGREIARKMLEAGNVALDEMRLSVKERSAYREILGIPDPALRAPQPPGSKPPKSVKSSGGSGKPAARNSRAAFS